MDKSKTTALGRFLGLFICTLLLWPTGTAAEPGIELIKKVNGHDATTHAMVYGGSTLSDISQVINTGEQESTNLGKELLSLPFLKQTERAGGVALPQATLTGFNREIQDEADDLATRATWHFAAGENACREQQYQEATDWCKKSIDFLPTMSAYLNQGMRSRISRHSARLR